MLWNLVWFLLIGLAAGWLAGQLTIGSDFGLKGNLIVGVLGAMLGGVLLLILGLHTSNRIGELVAATVGAVLLLFLLRRYGRRP